MPRFTIDVGERFDELLTSMAKSEDTTKSEIIRRSVAAYIYLVNETERGKNGKKVSITNDKDQVIKDVVLP